MINKSAIIALSCMALKCTSAYAQDWRDNWRNSPLTSKNSNEWRKKPYISKTSDSWRSSPLCARQSESKLRWNTGKWKKSSMNWRNSPYIKRPVDSSRWQNRWDKRKWKYSPLNCRNSELRYKNTTIKYKGGSVLQRVKEWLPSDREADKAPIPEEKKEYVEPQIETIVEEVERIPEEAPYNLEHTENYFIVYSGKKAFKIEKNVQKSIHLAPGGLIEIYSSNAGNN
jgi:hypothetical protein